MVEHFQQILPTKSNRKRNVDELNTKQSLKRPKSVKRTASEAFSRKFYKSFFKDHFRKTH